MIANEFSLVDKGCSGVRGLFGVASRVASVGLASIEFALAADLILVVDLILFVLRIDFIAMN